MWITVCFKLRNADIHDNKEITTMWSRCPVCKSSFEVDAGMFSKFVQCPSCKQQFMAELTFEPPTDVVNNDSQMQKQPPAESKTQLLQQEAIARIASIAEKIKEVKLEEITKEIKIDFSAKKVEIELDQNALKQVHAGTQTIARYRSQGRFLRGQSILDLWRRMDHYTLDSFS